MSEPTRPIRQPVVDQDGSLVAHTVATPKSFKVRAQVTVGPRKVVPVIFVPGIMGTNLRVRKDARLPSDSELRPGQAVWRPPNGSIDGLKETRKWRKRDPAQRQNILDPSILEVDDGGELDYPTYMLSQQEMRARGWGEIHAASYGDLLAQLQRYLDTTFWVDQQGRRRVREHWKRVMDCDPARWGARKVDPVTEQELERYAGYQYPVYAVGYNWLQSCRHSAKRLGKRIDEIKKFWNDRKHVCNQVILITHSMGGLVARACARSRARDANDPADIAGIIHGVMPTFGAPVAYRRIAAGTEGSSFSNGVVDNLKAVAFAEIAGDTPEETTPVMAVSPGALQLLPNHFYPRPWLFVKSMPPGEQRAAVRQLLALPAGDPYELYRDLHSWYRMIDPGLADPAVKYPAEEEQGVEKVILRAINEAEKFHKEVLSITKTAGGAREAVPYFHPNTSVFYGGDDELRSYGRVDWFGQEARNQTLPLTQGNVGGAKFVRGGEDGAREVEVEGRYRLQFRISPPDDAGDATVPRISGKGPHGYVKQVFETRGYRHQDSFGDADMLLLTRHLIVKIAQGLK